MQVATATVSMKYSYIYIYIYCIYFKQTSCGSAFEKKFFFFFFVQWDISYVMYFGNKYFWFISPYVEAKWQNKLNLISHIIFVGTECFYSSINLSFLIYIFTIKQTILLHYYIPFCSMRCFLQDTIFK